MRMKYGVPENFEYALAEALVGLEVDGYGEVSETRTFTDVGMLTMNAGVVVTFEGGLEMQLTINHSSGLLPGDRWDDCDVHEGEEGE